MCQRHFDFTSRRDYLWRWRDETRTIIPQIQASFVKQLADYVDTPEISNYIVHVELGDDAGITGALMLAKKLLNRFT